MNCASTQERLFDYLDERLDDATRRAVERHLAGCAECGAYASAAQTPLEPEEGWTAAVLEGTTGSACAQAGLQLPSYVDHAMDALDAELLGGHLEFCAPCATLVDVHRALAVDLPGLAEIQSDAQFLDDVLAATVPQIPLRSAAAWGARVETWVGQLIQRPRIAWEGAYFATVMLVLIVVFPGSPFAAVPTRAIEIARADAQRIERPFISLEESINVGAQEMWINTRQAARKTASGSSGLYRQARQEIGTLWSRIASEPMNTVEETTQQRTSTNGELR